MSVQGSTFDVWRASLERVHGWFVRARSKGGGFSVKAFFVFVAINLFCFWWALLTAYPDKLHGLKAVEYALIGFPVAVMGAAFDVASLAITLWAVSRALKARSNAAYLAFLSIDLLIAVLATFWVLFAFIVSGWLVAQILPINETLADRADLYQERLADIVVHPLARETIKNVYFGMIMGASAMIPTMAHAAVALWAAARTVRRQAFAR